MCLQIAWPYSILKTWRRSILELYSSNIVANTVVSNLGCWGDASVKALAGPGFITVLDRNIINRYMSNEYCGAYCSYLGYMYSGTEVG